MLFVAAPVPLLVAMGFATRFFVPILYVLFLSGTAACQNGIACAVLSNHDGDTLTANCSGTQRKIRLSSVDAPELAQPYGDAAQQFTEALTLQQDVMVTIHDIDKYGRTVAAVTLPGGKDLARELVRAGLAWHYARYSRDPELAVLEAAARASRTGLWAQPAPQNPSEFRHGPEGKPEAQATRSRARRSERRTLVAGR